MQPPYALTLAPRVQVNVAVFNAFPGGGMAYGTKEGRLRLLRYDRCDGV